MNAVTVEVSGSGQVADKIFGREEVQELRGWDIGRIIPFDMEMTKNEIGVVLQRVIVS